MPRLDGETRLVALRLASFSAEIDAVCLCEVRLVPSTHQPACCLRTLTAISCMCSIFEAFRSQTARGPTYHPLHMVHQTVWPVTQMISEVCVLRKQHPALGWRFHFLSLTAQSHHRPRNLACVK